MKKSEAPQVARDAKGRILPGASGNPGGQSAWLRAFRESLQSRAAPLAAQTLLDVMNGSEPDATPADRLRAADITLSYCLPKPKQEVEVSGAPSSPLAGMTPEQLLALIKGAS